MPILEQHLFRACTTQMQTAELYLAAHDKDGDGFLLPVELEDCLIEALRDGAMSDVAERKQVAAGIAEEWALRAGAEPGSERIGLGALDRLLQAAQSRCPKRGSKRSLDTVADDGTSAPAKLPHVRVGVAVIVRRPDGRILLGERLGSHGAGKVAFPGGHLEHGESFEECAVREVAEETGIAIGTTPRHVATTNDVMTMDRKHYVTMFMLAELAKNVEPQNLEPHKCKGWSWVSWQEIRELPDSSKFVPIINLLKDTQYDALTK